MVCGAQCNFSSAFQQHTHTLTYTAYTLPSFVGALIFLFDGIVYVRLLSSFCPHSHPKKLHYFIMPEYNEESFTFMCILQLLHSLCLHEIYDHSFVCPVNPSVLPNNSIKLVPSPHRIHSMLSSNRYSCEWIVCRKICNNIAIGWMWMWAFTISGSTEMKLLFLIKATPKTIFELFWFALFCLGCKMWHEVNHWYFHTYVCVYGKVVLIRMYGN